MSDKAATAPTTPPSNFIREHVLADNASAEVRGARRHALSAGAERLPAHRPRQGDLHRLRAGARVRRHLQPALRRHQPDDGRRRVRRRRSRPTSRWLGFEWDNLYYASDYFEQLYQYRREADREGRRLRRLASTEEQIREYRGNYYKKGKPSPYRDRTVDENLDLFRRMRAGEFKEGEHVLRAKIDLNSQNMNLRDPLLYRIRYARAPPHRQQVVHLSAVRLRAPAVGRDREDHALDLHARVRGAPAALRLVHPRGGGVPVAADRVRAAQPDLHGHVEAQARSSWCRRSCVAAGTIRACRRWRACGGAASRPRRSAPSASASAWPRPTASSTWGCSSTTLREDLNRRCPRVMAVLRPLKVVIENFPEGEMRELDAPLHPEDAAHGHAQGAVFARALHRARRLPRRSAEGLVPPGAGARGAAALRLPHQVHAR